MRERAAPRPLDIPKGVACYRRDARIQAGLIALGLQLYASELQESGFLYQDTIDESYPQRDFHTMYVGKIEKILVKDDEYIGKEK